MNSAENNSLFVDLSNTESANVNGGDGLDVSMMSSGRDGVGTTAKFGLGDYIFMIGAGTLFGNPGLTQTEIQYAWEQSIYF